MNSDELLKPDIKLRYGDKDPGEVTDREGTKIMKEHRDNIQMK